MADCQLHHMRPKTCGFIILPSTLVAQCFTFLEYISWIRLARTSPLLYHTSFMTGASPSCWSIVWPLQFGLSDRVSVDRYKHGLSCALNRPNFRPKHMHIQETSIVESTPFVSTVAAHVTYLRMHSFVLDVIAAFTQLQSLVTYAVRAAHISVLPPSLKCIRTDDDNRLEINDLWALAKQCPLLEELTIGLYPIFVSPHNALSRCTFSHLGVLRVSCYSMGMVCELLHDTPNLKQLCVSDVDQKFECAPRTVPPQLTYLTLYNTMLHPLFVHQLVGMLRSSKDTMICIWFSNCYPMDDDDSQEKSAACCKHLVGFKSLQQVCIRHSYVSFSEKFGQHGSAYPFTPPMDADFLTTLPYQLSFEPHTQHAST